ncbi:MAG TPA: glutamine amidotransferase, partial [Pirellulales bacterium]|nr:glutamine amidotransferase [Pirellulales bacterium]
MLRAVSLTFDPIGNIWLVAGLVVFLGALLVLGPARDKITPGRRRVLVGLRIAVIVLTLLALLRPTLIHTTTTRQPAELIVLADQSRSMQVDDTAGKKTRWDLLRNVLTEAGPTLVGLKDRLEVKGFAFDGQLHPLSLGETGFTLPDEAKGTETAMGAVLDEMLREESGKRLAGVILLGDGAQRALPPRDMSPQLPARRLADLGYPLYTVPLGQSRGQGQVRDVAVESLFVPSSVFVKNELPAEAVIRADGFVNQVMPVQLLFETSPGEMTPVAAEQIRPRVDGQRMSSTLTYVPIVPGEFKVTMRVPPQPGELVTSNNEMSTFVTVLKGGLNVLYLEGVARIETKFLRRALDASPDIKLDYLRLDAQKPGTKPADFAERFKPGKYDVYIIGDLDSSVFTPAELTQLGADVERGAGLIMLGGFHSFGAGGYGQTPLAGVLPIGIDRLERQNFNEPIRGDLHLAGRPKMRPTQIGSTQSLMQLAARDRNASAWAELPPLEGANRFRSTKPGAQVLADSAAGEPLLVAKDYGAGRVLAFAGDSTWHWWMTGHEALHKRFWRQTVLWLARKDASTEGSIAITLESRRFAPIARVEFTLSAHTPQGDIIPDATFTADVLGPDKKPGPVRLRRQGDHM